MVNGIQGSSSMNVDMMNAMREKMFARMDPDGDNQIDLAEVKSTAENAGKTGGRFTKMVEDLTATDTNGDGMVSREEFDQMPPPPPPPPPSGSAGGMSEEFFNLLDFDGDGQIDLTELQSQSEEIGAVNSHFVNLLEKLSEGDTDGNGIISQGEFNAIEFGNPKPTDLTSQFYSNNSNSVGVNNLVGDLLDQLG